MLLIPKTTKQSTMTRDETTTPVRKNTAVRFQDRKRRQAGAGPQPRKFSSGNSYCETKVNYPNEIIRNALQKNEELSIDLFQQLYDSKCKDPIQTRGFNIDEEQLCSGIPKIIFPRKAGNLDEKWRYVVNIDNYTQSVEIEECYNFNDYGDYPEETNSVQFGDKEEQNDFGVCLYSGAQGNNPDLTTCKQIYTEHKLLALDPEKGQLLVDSFKLPSACACFVREDFILEFRNGNMEAELGESKADSALHSLPPQVEEGDIQAEPFQFTE